jgi:hypothetical protein
MNSSSAFRFRPTVEDLEGRAMMSTLLAAQTVDQVYMTYTLEDCLISGYQAGGTGAADKIDLRIPAAGK